MMSLQRWHGRLQRSAAGELHARRPAAGGQRYPLDGRHLPVHHVAIARQSRRQRAVPGPVRRVRQQHPAAEPPVRVTVRQRRAFGRLEARPPATKSPRSSPTRSSTRYARQMNARRAALSDRPPLLAVRQECIPICVDAERAQVDEGVVFVRRGAVADVEHPDPALLRRADEGLRARDGLRAARVHPLAPGVFGVRAPIAHELPLKRRVVETVSSRSRITAGGSD